MHLTDFGELVKTLRQNSLDENGNCLTRETICERVHLTAHQLGRLERGDRKYLDNQTLLLLANSLNLTNPERIEFLYAALGLTDKSGSDFIDPEWQLNNLCSALENLQVPAYIMDVYGDLLAINEANLALYQITPDMLDYFGKLPIGHNLMHIIYSSTLGYKDFLGEQAWREVATMAMLFFRRSTLRYRHTDYFSFLIRELLNETSFDIDWYSSHRFNYQLDMTYEFISFKHPCHGPLSYIITETAAATIKGNLYLMVNNPSDIATISAFSEMIGEHGNKVRRLAPWPEKQF